MPEPAGPPCGNCGEPLQILTLQGHYGARVELDLCAGCHLVWFDGVETARLSGPGTLALVGAMAAAQSVPHRTLRPGLACLRCAGPLQTVHNRSRWGRSQQLQCRHRHGAWQSFAQFLSEKGYARPMSSADRARLLQRDGHLLCVNCGGVFGEAGGDCPWCQSVPAVIDVARLAQALDPEGALAGHPVQQHAARSGALGCMACGAALPREAGWTCPQCGATVAAAGLAEACARLQELAPALHAHHQRPAPAVVARRLAAQEPAMQRQREWARQVQAEADARAGRGIELGGDDDAWSGTASRRPRWPAAVLGGAVLLLLRWCGGR